MTHPNQHNTDFSGVERQDGSQVAEVVAMYNSTVLDVTHVGQSKDRSKSALTLILVGALMVAAGVAMFGADAYLVDWDKYSTDYVAAQQLGNPLPPNPDSGLAWPGLILGIIGMFPLMMGLSRRSEKVVPNYTIGEGHDAVFHLPPQGLPDSAEFPLVRGGAGDFTVNFTAQMAGDVTMDGQRISLQDLVSSGRAGASGNYYSYPLPHGARCRLRHGDVVFHINSVNPGLVTVGREPVDKPFLGYVGGTFLFGALFFGLMISIPQDYLGLDDDDDMSDSRFAQYMFQPDEEEQEEPPPEEEQESQEEAGGTGQRHKGAEGKMGKPSSKNNAGLYAMKGPKDAIPQMARDFDPELQARNAGILGAMAQTSGHFLASPHGGAFAVGNDDEDVWGGLTGSEVGEAYGVGGLGLVGTGKGGGGTGEGTIGLGTTGLIGKGGGGGSGSGYGRGSGAGFGGRGKRVPRVRQARAKVKGQMDASIIRRIVRAHINEVRACYNQGLARNPTLRGRVAVQFMINATGRVSSSVVQSSSIKDRSVANCIAKAVKRWKFPKPKGGGIASVTYPFTLDPG